MEERQDLISRQDALDALGEEPPVWYDGEDEIAERNQWRRDVNAIKAVPSAQPNVHDFPKDADCISRQAAIDVVDSETISTNPEHFKSSEKFIEFMDDSDISSFGKWQWSNGFNTALTAVGIDLKNLPSAQHEIDFDEWCVDCKEYDHDKHCCPRFNKVIRRTVAEMKEGDHGYTFRQKMSITADMQKGEPMSDLIYRHDVIKAIETSRFLVDAIEKVMLLPSAQPKTGKWIDKSGGIEGAWNYCSVCGEQAIDLYDYCPNCGAMMKEGDEHD